MQCLAISQEFDILILFVNLFTFHCLIRELRMKRILSKKTVWARMRRRLLCDAGNDLELDLDGLLVSTHTSAPLVQHQADSYQK